MPYAIEALFEADDERRLRALWDELSTVSGSRYLQDNAVVPHIALAVGRGEFCDGICDEVQAMAAEASGWDVGVVGVASFFGAGVLYLAIAPDPRLTAFHDRLYASMRQRALWLDPHYWPERWRPHCTVAQRLDPQREEATLRLAASAELPRRLRIRELGVTRYMPTTFVGRWPLGQRKRSQPLQPV